MSEIALKFLVANFAAGLAILVMAVLRKPVRAAFGAGLAYGLWLLVPLAALASLLPPRIVEIVRPAPDIAAPVSPDVVLSGPVLAANPSVIEEPREVQAAPPSAIVARPLPPIAPASPPLDPWTIAALIWFLGAIAALAWQLRNQSRFMADARAGFAGPAVAGLFKPRIITPADFEDRFDPSEREVVLAHETIHLDRNDARINAAIALARCVCWFNPLVHLAAHLMRIDQELACDAAVVARFPRARSAYASALLKAELAARPLPLGCYWPARTEHPLMERIEMLKRAVPGRARRLAGAGAIALLAAAAGLTAWAAKPPEERFVEQTETRLGPSPTTPQPDQALRIVAVKRGLLEVRAASGDKYVHRYYEPGEGYTLRVGKGWAVTVDDGSAFEWRRGDQSLGLVDPAGGPVRAQQVDAELSKTQVDATPGGASATLDTPAPAPQQTPAPALQQARPLPINPSTTAMLSPFPAASAAGAEYPGSIPLDANKPIYLRGHVEQIDFDKTSYVLHVRANSISRGYGDDRSNRIYASPAAVAWELSPTNYFGDADAIRSDLMGKDIEVSGVNLNQDCNPGCKLRVKQVYVPLSGEVPLARPTDSTIGFFNLWYDGSSPVYANGKVERIEFSERTFDAYVRTAAQGLVPSRLMQVRLVYRYARADIERELMGKPVSISGWAARERAGVYCSPVCGMYAETILVGTDPGPWMRITPDGAELAWSVPPTTPRPTIVWPLRILVLKRERLEVTTGEGKKLVDRYFDPGTTYSLSVGFGWTVSTPDGSAFELRVNDASAGPLAAGPVTALKVDEVAQRLKLPLPPQPAGALRLVALKRERLEVSSRDVPKFVDRYFEPGEDYSTFGFGNDWTISTPDGSAFEWRMGDKPLAPLAKAGPVIALNLDNALNGLRDAIKLLNPPQAAPSASQPQSSPQPASPQPRLQPTRYEPQPAPQSSPSPINITSNTGQYLPSEGRAVYTGNVQATQGDFRLVTDKLTVTCRNSASGECEEIQSLIADDNVTFTDSEVSIRGDHAEYDTRGGAITFTGDVTSSRGNDSVFRGAKMIYRTADRQITVSGDRLTSSPN